MNISVNRFVLALLAGFVVAPVAVMPTMAAPKDIQVLKSYVGDWKGRGIFNMNATQETVVCKLGIVDSAPAKVLFDGRCAIAGTPPLSIKGALGYIEEKKRFEAVMSSNTSFSGVAVGKRRGNNIKFNLENKDPLSGADIIIDIDFAFKKDNILVDLKVTEISTGRSTTAAIPLKK